MDKIYDFENGRFLAKYRDIVSFDLHIRKPITQILGDSGSGKTLLINFVKNEKKNSRFNDKGNNDLSNIFAFDDIIELDDISKLTNSLIIVDRCDLILSKDIIDFILNDRSNHFLLFSRTCLPLGISPNYYGEFICNDNVISISYKYSEVGLQNSLSIYC